MPLVRATIRQIIRTGGGVPAWLLCYSGFEYGERQHEEKVIIAADFRLRRCFIGSSSVERLALQISFIEMML